MQYIFFNEEWNPNEKQKTNLDNTNNFGVIPTPNLNLQQRTDIQDYQFFE